MSSSPDQANQPTAAGIFFDRMLDVDFRRQHQVRFRDTDASGFVHYTNYIRMMEETEYAFLRSLNLCIVMLDEKGVFGFPRRSCEVQIHEPACLNDPLETWLQIDFCDGVKIGYRFEINRASDVIATGKFVLACCRFSPGQPPKAILIPDSFLNRFPQKQ